MKTALEVALDCLSRRAMTQYELQKRLKDKKFSDAEIAEAMARVAEWGYIDDQKLASSFCESRLQRHPCRRVREDMRNRGITDQLIEEVLSERYSPEEEYRQCLVLAGQLAKLEQNKPKRPAKGMRGKVSEKTLLTQKVGRKLILRGYPLGMIRSVLAELNMETLENDEF